MEKEYGREEDELKCVLTSAMFGVLYLTGGVFTPLIWFILQGGGSVNQTTAETPKREVHTVGLLQRD